MKEMNIAIPKELHSEFKIYCAEKNVKMKDALVIAINLILKKHNKTK